MTDENAPEELNRGARARAILRSIGSSPWNLAGLAIGFFTGVIGTVGQIIHSKDPTLITVATVFAGTFVGLLTYSFIHLHAFRVMFKERDLLTESLEQCRAQLKRNKEFNKEADKAFKNLSRERTKFDAAVLHFLMNPVGDPVAKGHAHQELVASLEAFLNAICDVAVTAVSARKMLPADLFEANIKLILPPEKGRKDHRYVTFARNRSTSDERLKTDRIPKPNYFVEKNGFFEILMRPNNTRGYLIVDDVLDQISRWQEESGEALVEPTIAAGQFYTACICSAIRGAKYAKNGRGGGRGAVKVNVDDVLLGAIFLDTFETKFDSKDDLSIMEELSLNIYSAIRAYDGALELADEGFYGWSQ